METELLHSYLLAQFFGLYLLISAIILLARHKFYRNMVNKIGADSGAITVGASYSVMLGIFLVMVHNVWVWNPQVLVTILCWAMLIRGILWLSFPETMVKIARHVFGGNGYYVGIIVAAVIGVILTSKGFHAVSY